MPIGVHVNMMVALLCNSPSHVSHDAGTADCCSSSAIVNVMLGQTLTGFWKAVTPLIQQQDGLHCLLRRYILDWALTLSWSL